MTSLITLENISKQYKSQNAVNQVSFTIHQGEIVGLVGENGAGKTTLLRILTGLIHPTSGSIHTSSTLRIGALIESPALQPNLSALENLKYMALQLNLKRSNHELQQTLEVVGLGDVDPKKPSKSFSLGMRQRLAIALAILDNPDFLILDEPINGLDPIGIKEMRQIILNLRDTHHMTILISSHILTELELVVDRYIIMHQGTILKQLSKQALQEELDEKLYLLTSDILRTKEVLDSQELSYATDQDYLTLPIETKPMMIVELLIKHQLSLLEIFKEKQSFEHYYLQLIKQGE